ncbi:glycosyl transferase [Sphingobacterium multivorum]|uniref:Uncharacterized protein n=1 Tax=Sphingobacterium multivorum TaxID=28454 RepID=A0A2X2JEC5_SPHMU|nr:glycosyl transferase [Sphingobacterium multivorum]QRQ60052.1 glycosyl transferase [Sphingobacterium multivorum]SPZ92074.1 Uncharacterised protein [Sphingobacterium multivorum]
MKVKEKIPVVSINLGRRIDRKNHIIGQFRDRAEFELRVVRAIEHTIGAIGLWQTLHKIVMDAEREQLNYVIICEDAHCFTSNYNEDNLRNLIKKADQKQADILLGGVSHFEDAVQVGQDLFWINYFSGFQFALIFNRFFKRILNLDFKEYDNIDMKMSEISQNMYCMYPFISIQKEFGYSDVTKKNEQKGRVDEYFKKTEQRLETLLSLRAQLENL